MRPHCLSQLGPIISPYMVERLHRMRGLPCSLYCRRRWVVWWHLFSASRPDSSDTCISLGLPLTLKNESYWRLWTLVLF